MKKLLYYFGLVFVAVFLFATHSKFLQDLDPFKESPLFVFGALDLKIYLPYVFGAAFGIVTAVIIALLNATDKYFWHFTIIIAVLEVIAVYLYNNSTIPANVWINFASLYYGLYAGLLIIMYSYIKHENATIATAKNAIARKNAPKKQLMNAQNQEFFANNLQFETIEQMLDAGYSNKVVSEHFGVNASTVSRRAKKMKEL